jgi:hypothetical protein
MRTLQIGNGATFVTCSVAHTAKLVAVCDDLALAVVLGGESDPGPGCSHCALCGYIAHEPTRCVLHDECPAADPTATLAYANAATALSDAGRDVPWARLELTSALGAWDHPDELAAHVLTHWQ